MLKYVPAALGIKNIGFLAQKRFIHSILCPRQVIGLDVSNFEYRIFVVVFLQMGAVEIIKANIQNSTCGFEF